jgi:hypothetical protein
MRTEIDVREDRAGELADYGTRRHTVELDAIRVPDIRHLVASHPRAIHRRELLAYFRDLTALLFAARVGDTPQREFHAPDLWHAAMTFHGEANEQVLEAWHLGRDLAVHLGYMATYPPPRHQLVYVLSVGTQS